MGIHVNFHFCHGELTCFTFISELSHCCHSANTEGEHQGGGVTKCSKGCCSTAEIDIENPVDYTFQFTNFLFPLLVKQSPLTLEPEVYLNKVEYLSAKDARGSPPDKPLFLLNSSFIFYG